ncbi:glycosyl transferase [Pseudonocardia kujensis]|uniref:macrolide family glycosyltransferase n=1 Tax=Pseudonocardia kujensis TaxID=1128675 RepID=UPI001E564996|nr:macrolide family glycosyltransferase [Pseudonocardia kujensis]MCE0767680.1 glycosyl transferase [Pseudonocardia kujensis]
MSHILMAGAGAHGHTNPHLGVVAELTERGHRVSWVIPEPFAATVAAAGATPLVVDSVVPDEAKGESWPEDPVAGMSLFLDEAEHVYPQVEKVLAGDRPDLVLYDIGGYPGRALAARWCLPLVQLSPSMVAWEGFEEDMGEALAFRRTSEHAAYQRRFQAWLDGLGIALNPDEFAGRPPRCLVEIPRVLQPHADRVDERVYTFVGPALDRRREERPAGSSDEPMVLVSLGSNYTRQPDFYRACAEAFAPLGWRVVIAAGAHVTAEEIGPVPAGVEIHRWVPQFAALGHARAFVTHAGAGGCSEGLYQGVPMIAVPQAVDQFGNAALLEALGVGRHVPREEASPARLRQALLELTGSPEVAARCAAVRTEVRAEGGARAAADVVESLLPG